MKVGHCELLNNYITAFVSHLVCCVLQARKLEESLESSKQKLEESRELLKTNENGESVLLSLSSMLV